MAISIEPQGHTDSNFNAVREVFVDNFDSHDELGASVAAYVDGKPVIDLWGGHVDVSRGRLWERNTIINAYSITKSITAICLHRLVDQGKVDLDAPVARYWPEFGQAGKADIPVTQIMNHRSGLSGVAEPLPTEAFYDWDRMVRAIERQNPWWDPGTMHGYHTLIFGWLVGEVIRRVSGKSVGAFWRDEVAGPLGVDFIIGLDEQDDDRVGDMIPGPPLQPGEPDPMADILADPEGMQAKSFMNPPWDLTETINTIPWRRAEIPGVNGHTNARALSKVFAALARGGELDGIRVLSSQIIDRATQEESHGPDAITVAVSRFGLGFALSSETYPMGGNPRSFGHAGVGGSIVFADPDAKLSIGYVTNKIGSSVGEDPRFTRLATALYKSL